MMSHRRLFLAIVSVLLLTASGVAANNTLTRRSRIGGDQKLVSPGDIFQLGLFPLADNTKWFLGIWFTVSPAAVIWVANRDRPLNASSSGIVTLTGAGDLVLLDAASNNETVWSSNSSSSAAAVALLDDSGNLVLTDDAGAMLWQSFDHPTNTYVSEMRIGKDVGTGAEWSLSSWRHADDPSAGDFRYVMDTRGSPELHIWRKGRKTYRTGPWNGVRFSGIPEMATYKGMFGFQFADTADEVSYMYHACDGSPPSRVVLHQSGVIHRMVWDSAALRWSSFWSGPRDECDRYGVCGAFGVCNEVDAVVCSCVWGFLPRSSVEWGMRNASGGCARSTPLQCGGGAGDEDGFHAVRGVKLPETHGSSVDPGGSLEECGRRCLANCSCTAYAASDIRGSGGGGSGCIQWFGELVDTRFIDGGQDLFVRLAKSDLDTAPASPEPVKTKKFVAVITILIIGFGLLLLWLGFLIWKKVWRGKEATMIDDIMIGDCPTYHFETIRGATGGFCPENEIGRGGFGIVYKGQMQDGQEIAVKKLSTDNRVQGLKEFKNEVDLIARLQHRNLVRLLGCCIHSSDRILVYEYMSNKSLDNFIFDLRRRATLSWKTRMDIILGIARGLLYLHQDSRHTMIHRDLKAANVLLNGEMVAKISDFGIAKLFSNIGNNLDSTVTERIVGTYGYMAPEYAMDGMVSFMQDVYSFGVLLLEIVTGRRNQRNFNLIAHAWKLFEENKCLKLLDPTMCDDCSLAELEQASTCIQVGLLCVQESPSQRPQMAVVIPMLSQQQVPGRPLRPVVCMPVITPADLRDMKEDTSGNFEMVITDLEGR
ncbi:receptor-like serine/threonine-protein kinase SD1-8 isoform X1 [Triticum dicoccoides]|uniref:receptor-like serine/threonine-protein kinase SD1-8 isoform X1 n=1 Tax=Triticum dicoccoides TaxID=85692 RepID=UPI00188F469B|nr:receptor-like serine/threonine-protein kinase SD1-8 isoform X1 [Triticum dicoccoides]